MDLVRINTIQTITCVDMHTTGEPTRIVCDGYPDLNGSSLLEQRAEARAKHDHIRRCLVQEPRGHNDMYGAVLRPDTELVRNKTAHIGVLFLTNDGYSTMCGHATIALGRFLFDTRNEKVFPNRREVRVDTTTMTAGINLHAPCGLVEITVPVKSRSGRGGGGEGGGSDIVDDGLCSDPTRSVSFINVPSFATGIAVTIEIPPSRAWPELQGRTSVTADFSYGGAFYCIIPATELGFENGLRQVDFEGMNRASKLLKAAVNENPQYKNLFRHPEHEDLGFLYSVMVVDKTLGLPSSDSQGAETGLCYFSDQQVDRSPTGSGVAAREALAVAKGERTVGQKWTYHSLLSNTCAGKGGFDSEIVQIKTTEGSSLPLVGVRVSGTASYVGTLTFCVELEDMLGSGGFLFEKLAT